MCPFYLQHPLHIDSLLHGMLNVYYPCWRAGFWSPLLLALNLLGRQLPFQHLVLQNIVLV